MHISDTLIKLREHTLLLRCAREEDAEMLLEYLKTTSAESRFLVREPEEITMTPEEEGKFIRYQNESKHNLMLLGFLDGSYVGTCSLTGMSQFRYRHRASIAVALFQKYTGLGIGSAMLETLISVAKDTGIEQLELEVVADNERAIALYKKMGFEICGTFPRNMKYKDGTYADAYWMMLQLSSKSEKDRRYL